MALNLGKISLRDIQANFDSKLVLSALELVEMDQVKEYELENDNKLSGYVLENRKRYLARLTMIGQSLNMACECGRLKDGPCVHVVALLTSWAIDLQRMEDAKDVEFEEPEPPAARPAGTNDPQIFLSASPQEILTDWKSRLENLTVKDMRELAAAWGAKLKGIIRDQVFTGLLEVISAPETLARVLDGLPPDSGRVLDLLCTLVDTVPNFNSEQIKPYLQAALAANGHKARPVDDCLQDLMRVGLFTNPTFDNYFPVPLQVLTLPRVNPTLVNPWSGAPLQIEAAQPFRFSQLALRLLLLAQGGRLQRAAQPRLVGAEAWPLNSAADKDLKEPEIIPEPMILESGLCAVLAHDLARPPEEVNLAARLLGAGGLWPAHASKKVSNKLPAWLQISPQEQSRRLFALAAAFPTQLELDLARSTGFTAWRVAHGVGYPVFLNGLGQARLRLVRLLARLPQGQWCGIDSILRMLHGLQPGWLPEFVSRQSGMYGERFWEKHPLWVIIGRRKVNPMDYGDWSKAYGQVYRAMLTRSLPWLGLLDVGLQNGNAVAVRLAEFGEFLVGRRADFPLPEVKSEVASLTLNAAGVLSLDLDAASLDLIHLVVQIAQPEKSTHSAPSPHSLLYRLSDTSLGEAFETGLTLNAITTRLQAGLRAPLPDAQRERLQRIWDRFGRLQIYEDMTLIELADDYALPELLAGSSLSQILLYTFSPRLVAVRSASIDNFIAELQARGYTPRMEPASGARMGMGGTHG